MKVEQWLPEDAAFWANKGKKIANINLWISVFCLILSFVVWVYFSVIAVRLNSFGYSFSETELFVLVSLPGLSGVILRIIYSFVIPIFGGRNFTVFSTLSLLIPTVGLTYALQNPNTSYLTFALIALACGFGGGNFSSSMANISLFFPKHKLGFALGLNGGIGNLGVGLFQLVAPWLMQLPVYGRSLNGLYLSSAIIFWLPIIVLATLLAWFKMNNLPDKSSLKEQLAIFGSRHLYLITLLYLGTFGTFIGCSVVYSLIAKYTFTNINPILILKLAFIGPVLASLTRVWGGGLSDKFGGRIISLMSFLLMIIAVIGIIYFGSIRPSFWLFFGVFLVLFAASGFGNAAVFKMVGELLTGVEKSATIGFSAAIGASGVFFLPNMFSWSLHAFSSLTMGLVIMIAYYLMGVTILSTIYRKLD